MPRLERRWRAGLSSWIATISVPFASYGVAGQATLKPAVCMNRASLDCRAAPRAGGRQRVAEEPWGC